MEGEEKMNVELMKAVVEASVPEQLTCPKCGGNGRAFVREDDAGVQCKCCGYESPNEEEWYE